MRTRVADYMVAAHSQGLAVARLLELAKDFPWLPPELVEQLRQLEITQLRLKGLAARLGIPLSAQPATEAEIPTQPTGQGPAHRPHGQATTRPDGPVHRADHAHP